MSELLLSMMVLGLVMVGQGGAGCFLRVVFTAQFFNYRFGKFAEFPHPTSKTRPPSPRGRRDRIGPRWGRLIQNAHLAFDRLSGVFFFLFRRRTLLCKRAVYRARPWAWELRQMF